MKVQREGSQQQKPKSFMGLRVTPVGGGALSLAEAVKKAKELRDDGHIVAAGI